MTSLPAPPHADIHPPVDPVDVVTDASGRFATHLEVLAHQLGESALTHAERERLAAELELTTRAVGQVARAAGLIAECGESLR